MNKIEAKKFIPILQGIIEDKIIQRQYIKRNGEIGWIDDDCEFLFLNSNYRIKPESTNIQENISDTDKFGKPSLKIIKQFADIAIRNTETFFESWLEADKLYYDYVEECYKMDKLPAYSVLDFIKESKKFIISKLNNENS